MKQFYFFVITGFIFILLFFVGAVYYLYNPQADGIFVISIAAMFLGVIFIKVGALS